MTIDSPEKNDGRATTPPGLDSIDEEQLLPQLVAHLRDNRAKLRREWEHRISNRQAMLATSLCSRPRRRRPTSPSAAAGATAVSEAPLRRRQPTAGPPNSPHRSAESNPTATLMPDTTTAER